MSGVLSSGAAAQQRRNLETPGRTQPLPVSLYGLGGGIKGGKRGEREYKKDIRWAGLQSFRPMLAELTEPTEITVRLIQSQTARDFAVMFT